MISQLGQNRTLGTLIVGKKKTVKILDCQLQSDGPIWIPELEVHQPSNLQSLQLQN